jgi:hypothetical protein
VWHSLVCHERSTSAGRGISGTCASANLKSAFRENSIAESRGPVGEDRSSSTGGLAVTLPLSSGLSLSAVSDGSAKGVYGNQYIQTCSSDLNRAT